MDDDAYYRIVQGADSLKVYNLGVFVEERPTWKTGLGGIVVSKRALRVNFARNAVMEDQCPVWKRISGRIESQVAQKLAGAKALTESERKYVAARLSNFDRYTWLNWREIKLLTDPSGKHLPLSALRSYKRLVHLDEQSSALACAAHGVDGTFVVTDKVLNRFGVSTLQDFLLLLEQLPGILPDRYEVVPPERVAHLGLGRAKTLSSDGLTRRERAAFDTLSMLNATLASRLMLLDGASQARELRVGAHRGNQFVAWTDGKTYITVNRRYLKMFNQGVDGVFEWLLTLIHEYSHDTDDSESHSHGEVFYRRFHDTAFSSVLSLASLARIGAKEYLAQLKARGVPRPRKLTRQLRE